MLDLKKIRAARKRMLRNEHKHHAHWLRQHWNSAMLRLTDPGSHEHRLHVWQSRLDALDRLAFRPFAAAVEAEDRVRVRAALGLSNGAFIQSKYLRAQLVAAQPFRRHSGGYQDGTKLLGLMASGYGEVAANLITNVFANQAIADDYFKTTLFGEYGDSNGSFDMNRHNWFGILFALDDPQVAWDYGIQPTPDQFGPFWLLLQNWADPDPTVPQNALQAAHEFLIANAMIGVERAKYIVGFDVLFWDYLPRAVNEKRKLRGLDPVQIETYLDEDWIGDTPLPFAKDNLFWPSHLRFCEELGIPPFEFPGEVVEVELDPETAAMVLV